MTVVSSALLVTARAALAASFLLFIPGLFEQFEAPKAGALRVLGIAALAAGLAFAPGLRRLRRGWVDTALLAWLAVEAAATIASVAPRTSLLGEPEQRDGLLTSLGLGGLYLAARLGARAPRCVRRTLDVALASAAIAGLYALAQVLGIDPLRYTRTAGFGALSMRPFGTFGHPNLLGVVSGAAAAAALAMAIGAPGRRLRYVLVAGVATVATLLTLSRGAWLGIAAGMLVAALLAWRAAARAEARLQAPTRAGAARAATAPRLAARRPLVVAAVVLVALAGAALAAGPQWRALIRERIGDPAALSGGSGRARVEIWASALAAWRARPLLGHGPDTFAMVFPRYQTAEYWRHEWSGLPLHSHSIYLHTLATRGALGALAAAGGLLALALAARAAWRAGAESRRLVAALAAALVAIGVSGLVGSIGVGGMLWGTLIAAGLATLAEGGARETRADRRGSVSGRAPFVVGAFAGLATLGWVAFDLAASAQDRRGLTLMTYSTQVTGERARLARLAAAKAYEEAAALMPFEDVLFRRRAEALRFLAATGESPARYMAEAEHQARRSVALAPLRAINHRYLGLIMLSGVQLGDASRLPPGEAAYARCLALAPHDALAMVELARAEIELGRPRQALEPARRAAALYPAQGETLAALGLAHRAVGDAAEARAALERALTLPWGEDTDLKQAAETALRDLGAGGP